MDAAVKWTGKYKHNWEEACKYLTAWWNCEETDRPLIFNPVPKSPGERKGRFISATNPSEAARFDLDADIKLNNTRYNLENSLYFAEAVPGAFCNFASLLGMLCVQAGGKINYAPGTFTAWLEEEDDLFDLPLPELASPCRELKFAIDMIHRNHEAFGYDAVLGANPMLDPMTTLSLMRGSSNFLMDLIEREEDVLRWLKRLGEFHSQAVVSYREARAVHDRREEYNWTGAWAPGDMDAIQCDVCTMLSPEMFRKFAMPEMEKEAAFFDYTIWHLDGSDEFKHIDDICNIPNLHAIQYVDEKGRDISCFADVWKKITGKGKSLLFHTKSEYALSLTKLLGCKGLSFYLMDIDSEEKMLRFLERLEEN
jgi:hypothetical protein